MKILFLHKWLVMGGIERILINYLSILSQENDLQIDVLIDYDTESSIFREEIPSNVNLFHVFERNYFEKKKNLYKEKNNNLIKKIIYKITNFREKLVKRKYLTNLVRNGNYTVIINFSNHFDPYICFNNIRIPIIRWQHSTYEISIKEKNFLKEYDKIVVICEDMRDFLLNQTKISPEKFSVIYNPVNIEKIRRLSNEKIDFIIEDFFVQMARIDKNKKHKDLILIYSELIKRGITQKLVIIGDGPELNSLKHLTKQLNLQDKCIFLGEISNPYPYMKNATLFLHTSEKEGLPTVLLESLILGVPVIAMNCPTGPREILDNGKFGVLVDMGDFESFINKTKEYTKNKMKIEMLKENIENHLLKFSEVEIKNKFLSTIKELTLLNSKIDQY